MDGDYGCQQHRHKRARNQMDHEGITAPTWSFDRVSASRDFDSPPHPNTSGLHLPRSANMPAEQSTRFVGDGYDFRRPVMSNNIIDLTADDAGPSEANAPRLPRWPLPQRAPRFGRDIIEVDDVVDVDNDPELQQRAPPLSPEIQFVSARTLPHLRTEAQVHTVADDEGEEVEITGVNRIAQAPHRLGPQTPEEWLRERINQVSRDERAFARLHARLRQRRQAPRLPNGPVPPPRNRGAGYIHMPIVNVGFLAYDAVGFEMGQGQQQAAPPPPTYDAPDPAPEGFTRSPAEDDVLICPNCDIELCTGDSDQQKQVWIVKACGHAYCGECAGNRQVKKTTKGKEKLPSTSVKPFKICVVGGCDKKVYHRNAMIQIFL